MFEINVADAQQLLFEAFSYIMRIFGTVEPHTESTLPFLYIMIFQRWQYFEAPSSTPEEDRHVHLLTFLYRLQCCTNFV